MSFLGGLVKKIGHVIAAPIKGVEHLVTDPAGWAGNIAQQATDPKTLIGLASTLALPGVGGALTGALGAIPGVGALGSALGSAAGGINSVLKAIPGVSGIEHALGIGGDAAGSVASAIPDGAFDTSLGSMLGGASESAAGGLAGLINSIGNSPLGAAARALNGGKALTLGNLAGEAGQKLGDVAGSATDFLTGNNGLNALGVAQGINAAELGKKSNDLANQALGSATSSYNERAPLRAAGQAALLNPQTQDLSGLGAIAGQLKPYSAPTTLPATADLSKLQGLQGGLASAPQPSAQPSLGALSALQGQGLASAPSSPSPIDLSKLQALSAQPLAKAPTPLRVQPTTAGALSSTMKTGNPYA